MPPAQYLHCWFLLEEGERTGRHEHLCQPCGEILGEKRHRECHQTERWGFILGFLLSWWCIFRLNVAFHQPSLQQKQLEGSRAHTEDFHTRLPHTPTRCRRRALWAGSRRISVTQGMETESALVDLQNSMWAHCKLAGNFQNMNHSLYALHILTCTRQICSSGWVHF